MIKFKGAARRIDDFDIPRIASIIGCGEDELHAVMDVEASGGGFDRDGRPKMLFEPHVFWRNLSEPKRSTAVSAGVAYPKWQRGNYPKDSYPRLYRAMEIDETAALKSASWGLGQVLGENYAAAGYPSPQKMIEAFVDDEAAHLEAMIRFIKANKLDDELRRHDWEGFARGYNGQQYAANDYHLKLARSYDRWSKIKDTLWTPTHTVEVAPSPPMLPPDIEPPLPPAPPREPGFWEKFAALFRPKV